MATPPKPKPVGHAVAWSQAEIDRLAEITPEDIASAKATFKRLAPKRIKTLLDARTDGRKSKPAP